MTSEPQQLTLSVSLREETTFANFVDNTERNALTLAMLKAIAEGRSKQNVFIWGPKGAGLTHLLQAVCHEAHANGRSVQYVPLMDVIAKDPFVLCDGLEIQQIVCLDGIDRCAGNRDWEQAIFHLYNNLTDVGYSVVMASHQSPTELSIQLPDLRSRVLSGVIFYVAALSDDDKRGAIMIRAAERGMDMPEDVANYILTHASRDVTALFKLLDKIDEASLREQRKLTIPFVKSVMMYS